MKQQIIQKYEVPITHYVIDNFLPKEQAQTLSREFVEYNNTNWIVYDNPLENKKALNNYHLFPPNTYKFFNYLLSQDFVNFLKKLTTLDTLYSDPGLHGAGWHIHGRGGKLNIHLDYDVHPKLELQRKLNFIFYLTENWNSDWGGDLELWSHDELTNQPKEKVSVIENKFNRAIIFDTTQNSWHGFPKQISCPEYMFRKSIASYYLTDLPNNHSSRKRALYSLNEEQKNNSQLKELVKKRTEFNINNLNENKPNV